MRSQMNTVEEKRMSKGRVQTKKPGDVGASLPAELNLRSHSITNTEEVSMHEPPLR